MLRTKESIRNKFSIKRQLQDLRLPSERLRNLEIEKVNDMAVRIFKSFKLLLNVFVEG